MTDRYPQVPPGFGPGDVGQGGGGGGGGGRDNTTVTRTIATTSKIAARTIATTSTIAARTIATTRTTRSGIPVPGFRLPRSPAPRAVRRAEAAV